MKNKLKDAAIHREIYNSRKEAGLCTYCGKEMAVDGKIYCQQCRDKRSQKNKATKRREYQRSYMNELRAYRKNHNLCTQCGKQDARTLIGKNLCFECRKNKTENERRRKSESDIKIIKNEAARKKREELVKAGLCSKCGKNLVEDGYKTCAACRAKDRNRQQRSRNRENRNDPLYGIPRISWPDLGYCYICKNPLNKTVDTWNTHEKHSRICKTCYDKLVKAGEKGRKAQEDQGVYSPRKAVDDFWRLYKAEKSARIN